MNYPIPSLSLSHLHSIIHAILVHVPPFTFHQLPPLNGHLVLFFSILLSLYFNLFCYYYYYHYYTPLGRKCAVDKYELRGYEAAEAEAEEAVR